MKKEEFMSIINSEEFASLVNHDNIVDLEIIIAENDGKYNLPSFCSVDPQIETDNEGVPMNAYISITQVIDLSETNTMLDKLCKEAQDNGIASLYCSDRESKEYVEQLIINIQ
jgi:hypothetical protein